MAIFEPSDLFDFAPVKPAPAAETENGSEGGRAGGENNGTDEGDDNATNGSNDNGTNGDDARRDTVSSEDSATANGSANDTAEMNGKYQNGAKTPTAALNRAPYSPPEPEPFDGPFEYDDEERAMIEMEIEAEMETVQRSTDKGKGKEREETAEEKAKRDEAARRRRAAILGMSGNGSVQNGDSSASESVPTASESASGSGMSFGPSLFDSVTPAAATTFEPDFDFGLPARPAQPVASSSRICDDLTPPPEVDFSSEVFDELGRVLPRVTAATADGNFVTFKRRQRRRADLQTGGEAQVELLSTPLHVLMREVDEVRSREKAVELQREIDNERQEARKPPAMTMWVDKYRPKKFSDLLGEDRVHRDVMAWLKEWDRCVFKRIPPRKRKVDDEENKFVDHLGRPRERVLLLSGPPGYGKTTLAHVVARHAGYRTLEINASDDRSAATVTTRIKNALDAGSGLGAEGRPTCVIIDEIDGASGGGDASFIKSLIKLIQDVPAKKKSKAPAQVLRRPIICICNDLYASALRPLRPFARIVRFRKPPSQYIVQRLREICDRERLTADLRVLTALVDVTSGDVRSCLNTLQFIKSKSSTVTHDAIKTAAVGTKDSGTSLQTAWNNLFTPMAAKQRRKQMGIDDRRYVDRLAFMVQACGEYDRVVQGCFEHYPNLKPLDASFTNICRLHDWVAYYDRLSGRVSEHMEFELMNYMPYAVVPWYSHFAAPSNATRPAEWPKADYEAYTARVANEEIATALLASVPPSLRSMFSSQGAQIELIPLLMRIISPPLKPVNANIVKPHERRVLARLVELMIPLGLRFWQEQTEDGQPMMRLDPAIDVFVHYDGKRADDVQASRFAVRQLVAQAIDAEIARRRGQAGADADGKGTATADSLSEQYGAAKTGSTKGATDAPAAAPTDFFGRVKVPPTAVTDGAQGTTGIEPPKTKRFKAKYKFNEGSSAAVRKPIKMSALM